MRRTMKWWCGATVPSGTDISPQVLKNHCHDMIITLGPATPPEAFLFRGNAYFELGFPYLALADYNTAAGVLNLSGAHQNKCFLALDKFPETQVATYPSSDSHVHLFVTPMLGEGVALQHVNDAVGRGIVAQKALQGGSTVIKPCEPWLKYPILDNSCSNCGCPLPDRSFPCNNENCHEEYCSRDCRTMALGLYHRHVCYNEAFQNIELDVYAQLHAAQKDGDVSVRNATAAQLLALRVISAALIVQTVPSVLPQMRILSGKLSFNPKTLGGSMLHLYERLSRALQIQTIISYEEFLGVLARITANCFQREDSIELHHARSMMNHSCRANAAEDGMTGAIVTKQPVEEGGEVCINYYPQLKDLPYAERTVELRRRGFVCQCTQCQKKI